MDRLHKREAEAQVILNGAPALPLVYNQAFYPTAHAAFAPINPLIYNSPVAAAPIAPATSVLYNHQQFPFVYNTPFAPVASVTPVVYNSAVPQLRPYSPHDCASPAGCAVRTLKDHGLAKREAEAEPEAEAEAEAYYYGYYPRATAHHALNPYYNSYNSYRNNPYYSNSYYGLNPHQYSNGYYGNQYANQYANSYYNTPYAYPQQFLAPAVVEAPVVVEAAPAVVEVAPVVYNNPFVYHTPAVVAAPRVAPVVEEVAKHVTYTHLGAHPIHPTTVLEKTSRVVGHTVY